MTGNAKATWADVLVVGSGIAGCSAAFAAARAGANVLVATKATRPENAATHWAQGGIAVTRDKPESLRASFATKIEVEVEGPIDGERAAEVGADIVLLDNCSPAEVERGVELLPDEVLAEASGGIEIEDVPVYTETGVDVISMGSLTHSARSLDFSFRTGRGRFDS
ncbi:FAD-dependent oxidoreductase [Haladaptatus sp. DFWS20]|uniref:FAD-dependent oxidoreductase n=1 Tax=Haladaptatus sp. DFWS20 TaxID=3403467 RepID=UPI003EBCDB88